METSHQFPLHPLPSTGMKQVGTERVGMGIGMRMGMGIGMRMGMRARARKRPREQERATTRDGVWVWSRWGLGVAFE